MSVAGADTQVYVYTLLCDHGLGFWEMSLVHTRTNDNMMNVVLWGTRTSHQVVSVKHSSAAVQYVDTRPYPL